MATKNTFKTTLSLISFSLIVSSCGGGGGGGGNSNTPPERAKGTLSGVVFDAPVGGAIVSAWEYENGRLGRLLDEVKSGVDGRYTLKLQTSSKPVYIEAKGGAYLDPYTDKQINESNGQKLHLRAVLNYREGDNTTQMITPLTNMLTGLAEFKIHNQGDDVSDAISDTSATLEQLYSFDVNLVEPIDIVNSGQSSMPTSGHKYGALLTAYSSFSYDLMDPNNEDDPLLYTSMHLADIQYRDIRADGKLDGREKDVITGGSAVMSFGKKSVGSELYTHDLAKSLLNVVNDTKINHSSTAGKDYVDFANHISGLGSNSSANSGGGVIPPRDETPIDNVKPTVSREKPGEILQGENGQIRLTLSDDVGIQDVSVSLDYGTGTFLCVAQGETILDSFCSINRGVFTAGQRETQVDVIIDTVKVDQEQATDALDQAKLIVTPYEVEPYVGKPEDETTEIRFQWDNQYPVINFKGGDVGAVKCDSFNNDECQYAEKYELQGTVSDAELTGKVQVGKKGEELFTIDCKSQGENTCAFYYEVGIDKNLNKTLLEIRASDKRGNETVKDFPIFRDTKQPILSEIIFPEGDMNFIYDGDSGRVQSKEKYTDKTYPDTEEAAGEAKFYLDINRSIAKNGIAVDNFDPAYLDNNSIPYISIKASDFFEQDPTSGIAISTPSEELKVEVVCSKKRGEQWIPYQARQEQLPRIAPSNPGDDITYYLPYTRQTCGQILINQSNDQDLFKIDVRVVDNAGRKSQTESAYFKKTFNLPRIKIHTPFIEAQVRAEVLNPESGNFESLGVCTTRTDEGDEYHDRASCEIEAEINENSRIRVKLLGQASFYNWCNNNCSESNKTTVTLTEKNNPTPYLGAYYKVEKSGESLDLHLTELSAYQMGLFEFLWNKADDKSIASFDTILDQVETALSGSSLGSNDDKPFFGFDPTITSYAFGDMLKEITDQQAASNEFIHRFLAEALNKIPEDNPQNGSDWARAIFNDLKADGKADGKGSQGQDIFVNGNQLTEETYRKDLAQAYFNVATDTYGVTKHIAQDYADDIFNANPKLGDETILGPICDSTLLGQKCETSIDKMPPSVSLEFSEESRTIEVSKKRYVAGSISANITVEDESKIVNGPQFSSKWYKKDEGGYVDGGENLLKIDGVNPDDAYKKQYNFNLQTVANELKDIAKFELITQVSDDKGNDYAEGKEHINTVYVDNDFPVVEYVPPMVNGVQVSQDDFLSTHGGITHDLKFTFDDLVGDDIDSRQIQFSKDGSTTQTISPQGNQDESFKIKLCSVNEESCGENDVQLDDGIWNVKVAAKDNLGNERTLGDTNATTFHIKVDSTPPEVKSNVSEESTPPVLSGNAEWQPIIDWGSLSSRASVDISLKKQSSGSDVKLAPCLDDSKKEGDSQTPCIIIPQEGSSEPVKVQLFADYFRQDKDNPDIATFTVKASDNAKPSNEGSGEFKYSIDNQGPVVTYADAWVVDNVSKETGELVGPNFTVKLASVEDISKVSNVEIWQVESSEAIRSIKPQNPSQPIDIEINSEQSAKITIDDNNRAYLFVKAIDEYGFSSDTDAKTIILDREGPSLTLNKFNGNNYYRGNYVFTLSAEDLNKTGVQSTEGVNKDSLKFESFIDTASGSYTKVEEDMQVNLGGQDDGDSSTRTIILKGADVRGNTTKIDYKIKVQNKLPTINNVSFSYESGGAIDEGFITRDNDPVIITIDAEDPSGISGVTATYTYGELSNSNNIKFDVDKFGKWKGKLGVTEISNDGTYKLNFLVSNNVKVNESKDKLVETASRILNVQRQGVSLEIAKPDPFQSHISGKTLNVEFKPVGEVKAQTLECWVRENYTSDGAPDDGPDYAYSGEINNPQENYKCSVTTDRNMSISPVVLITRTVGKNNKETVKKFSFSMMDIDAPTVESGSTYQLGSGSIFYGEDGEKMLRITLSFKDSLSGVNIESTKPVLERNKGGIKFQPDSCGIGAEGITECTYTGLYSTIIDALSSKHLYTIRNLADTAGNVAPDYALELLKPSFNVGIEITSPKKDSPIRGSELSMNFKVKVDENSSLENLIANVNGQSYSWKDNEGIFSQLKVCEDDNSFSCATFKTELSDGLDGQQVKLSIKAIDIWNNSGESKVDVIVDNSKPIIGSDITVSESPTDPSKVRFLFSIRDEGSGLAKVKYTKYNPIEIIEKPYKEDGSHLYFELTKAELEGLSNLQVNIQATDKVGWSESQTLDIDLTAPTITLSFADISSLQEGKLAFTNERQSFTISSEEGGHVKAKHYSIDMIPTSGDTLNFSGNITSSTPNTGMTNGTMYFAIDDQAKYRYKLTVTDSMGRAITNFTLFNNTYNAESIESVVDYEDPEVSIVDTTQDDKATDDGKYQLDVTAQVTDKNLASVTSTVFNDLGLQVSQKSIIEPNPDDSYTFSHSLEPGNYKIKVTATDLVGKTGESRETDVEVVASKVPTLEIKIPTNANEPLAGGVEVPLTFTFSEKVTEFDISDVKLDENNGGELKPLSWSTTDNVTWTVTYVTPRDENKKVTISVEDNTYKSANNINGKGDSLQLDVDGVLPTLDAGETKVLPAEADANSLVTVTAVFTKAVTEPSA
ncbi:Ig-like domain-containing protein, partial [Vibrio sagamiensis]|uniref:Ig-like domain-containing protein n=2 Tax=Vibrio sagamiensis TaxID=512650 RepID=UPI001D109179